MRRSKRQPTIDPDEVLIDAFNLPEFDTDQFEGRVMTPISHLAAISVGIFFTLIIFAFAYRAWDLQVNRGSSFAALSENNRLEQSILFADRGVIYDRSMEELAWNVDDESAFTKRKYSNRDGLAHLIGFVGYPQKDSSGHWWREEYLGKSGVEQSLNDLLDGENGLELKEVSALNNVESESMVRSPVQGKNIILSINADMQEAAYKALKETAAYAGYVGGAMVVVDVKTGEIITLTSYPEFSSEVMSEGSDKVKINKYTNSKQKPFLNRAISAVYAPGSIVKPYVAAAALAEGLISQWKQILSTGVLTVPNPYHPDKPSRFLDWKAHGLVDVRQAIAVSSNIYFYAVGGGLAHNIGLGAQKGLGIDRLAAYAARFGFGEQTGIQLWGEVEGNVPNKRWKWETFGEEWLLGNTYHSSIGQYGWLVTPIQAAMYTAAIANGGTLLSPHILKDAKPDGASVGIDDKYLQIVREGMRIGVMEGTLSALNYNDMKIAAKTGTAQVGRNNEFQNSWVIGFWPSNNPEFAFAIVLERASSSTNYGAVNSSITFFNWLRENTVSSTIMRNE